MSEQNTEYERVTWEARRSSHSRPHVAYYNAYLADGRRLAVGRQYEDGRYVPGRWQWSVYQKPEQPHQTATPLLARGDCSTVSEGKRLALAWATQIDRHGADR